MPSIDLVVNGSVSRSTRAKQIEAVFDVPAVEKQRLSWRGELPIEDKEWSIGLIVGPSGCGKSTIARHLWPEEIKRTYSWGETSIIDDMPQHRTLDEISDALSSVGFNTIPAWLRPFGVLSNGEQFRTTLARALLEDGDPIVIDEFTSVVDRQVAKIACHSVQKSVRRAKRRLVAVSCHEDIVEWLQPDWVLRPATMSFEWRSLQRRPTLDIEIARVPFAAWRTFAPFHYLTSSLHKAAKCYVLFVNGQPASFGSLLFRPKGGGHNVGRDINRIYGVPRVVTLPDYQGLGLVFVLMEKMGACCKAIGHRMRIYPAHPPFVRACARSQETWRLFKKPGFQMSAAVGSRKADTDKNSMNLRNLGKRPNATFEYIGPAWHDSNEAEWFLGLPSSMRLKHKGNVSDFALDDEPVDDEEDASD